MQEERLHSDRNNPEPFVIWKNARKETKKSERLRKQSEQLPATSKKPRKMTIQVSHSKSLVQEQLSIRSFSESMGIEEEARVSVQDKVSQIGNISEEKEQQANHSMQSQELEPDIDIKIPFNCHEWELDRESPYLKTYNNMEEIDDLRLDG